MIRDLWESTNAWVKKRFPPGTLGWHVVTWVGHSAWTAVFVGLGALVELVATMPQWGPFAAGRLLGVAAGFGIYTTRTIQKRLLWGPPPEGRAPWWDDVMDVAGPVAVGLILAAL